LPRRLLFGGGSSLLVPRVRRKADARRTFRPLYTARRLARESPIPPKTKIASRGTAAGDGGTPKRVVAVQLLHRRSIGLPSPPPPRPQTLLGLVRDDETWKLENVSGISRWRGGSGRLRNRSCIVEITRRDAGSQVQGRTEGKTEEEKQAR